MTAGYSPDARSLEVLIETETASAVAAVAAERAEQAERATWKKLPGAWRVERQAPLDVVRRHAAAGWARGNANGRVGERGPGHGRGRGPSRGAHWCTPRVWPGRAAVPGEVGKSEDGEEVVGDMLRAGLPGRRDAASAFPGEGDEGDDGPLGGRSAAGERKGGVASEGPRHLVSEGRTATASEAADRALQSAARADAPEEGSASREARHHGVEAKASTPGAAARADGAMPRDGCEATRAKREVEAEDACSALGTALRGEVEQGSRKSGVAAHAGGSVGEDVAACAVLDEVEDRVGVVVRVRGKGREAETAMGCVPAEGVRGMIPVEEAGWEGSILGIQVEVGLGAGTGRNTLPAGEVVVGTRAGAASR
jgi:hypothetical protein